MLDREGVLRRLTGERERLRALTVRRLGLFGSFARGDARPDSDLDFVVELGRHDFENFMDTKFLLEDLFGRRVDLVPTHLIKPRLRDRILAEVIDVEGL